MARTKQVDTQPDVPATLQPVEPATPAQEPAIPVINEHRGKGGTYCEVPSVDGTHLVVHSVPDAQPGAEPSETK